MSDNTTAIHCIDKMRTSYSMECQYQVLNIREWGIILKNHLSAALLPEKIKQLLTKNLDQIMMIPN